MHVGRGGEPEALKYGPQYGVWTERDGVEYDFDNDIFTAARVAFDIAYESPFEWHFRSDVKSELGSVFKF